jgi:hypothetical protein
MPIMPHRKQCIAGKRELRAHHRKQMDTVCIQSAAVLVRLNLARSWYVEIKPVELAMGKVRIRFAVLLQK